MLKMHIIDMKFLRLLLTTTTRNRRAAFLNGFCRNYSMENPEEKGITIEEKIQLTKPSVTKWKRPPFLKNFFIGKFDVELMAFPEILDKEQVFELEENVKVLSNLMRDKVNSVEIDHTQRIPDDLLQDLKGMGLFGRSIPEKYGGLDLTYTANTRLNEALSVDWSIYSTLAAHEFFATQPILHFGTDAQKSLYLPKLASGDYIGALCCCESRSGSDLWSISTTAQENDKGEFVINGEKTWVTNAGRADLFVVFAKTENTVDAKLHDVTAFVVEKNMKGIRVTPKDKVCLRGLDTGTVMFEDVTVPKSNVIGAYGAGFQVYLKAVESFRIAMNTFTFGALKALVDSVTNYIIHYERIGTSLADYQIIRTKLSRISARIYGMESISYFTSAILDSTDKPDVEFESAALKLFNSEGTLYCLRELMALFGSSAQTPSTQLERFHRDAQGLAVFDAPNDIVRLFLGLSGCQSAGRVKAENIVKRRNVFFFPWDIMKEAFRQFRIRNNLYKFDQDIAGHLHPSLVLWANKLEKRLQWFDVAVDCLLAEHGIKVLETQIDPVKLADLASNLFAWSAVLSRCSRSYCIGLKNCHHEIRLAGAFCHDIDALVEKDLDTIFKGIARNNEGNHLMMGAQTIDCRGYFPEHPLKHNL